MYNSPFWLELDFEDGHPHLFNLFLPHIIGKRPAQEAGELFWYKLTAGWIRPRLMEALESLFNEHMDHSKSSFKGISSVPPEGTWGVWGGPAQTLCVTKSWETCHFFKAHKILIYQGKNLFPNSQTHSLALSQRLP